MSTPYDEPGGTGHLAWEELAVGHALHALEPEDEQSFLDHLRGCAACRQTVADTTAVMGDLALASEDAEPPDAIREGIMSVVLADDRARSFDELSRRRASAPGRAAGGRAQRRLFRPDRAPWVAVAAGVALVLALGVWNLVLHAENAAKQTQLAQARAVARCVEDPGCRQVRLTSPEGGAVLGVALVHDSRVDLVVDGLPRNDRQSTIYVLWQQLDGGSVPAIGTFDVTDPHLSLVAAGKLSGPLAKTQALAVTLEAGRSAPSKGSAPKAVGTVR